MILPLLLSLSTFALADVATLAQDPLCANADFFHKEYEQETATHRNYPQLQPAYAAQSQWFKAVTGEMESVCTADKKFAEQLLARVSPDLNGQCKPAEEVALRDQEVLQHSEDNLKTLRAKRSAFVSGGGTGALPLPTVAQEDVKLVRDYGLTLETVPRVSVCELKWIYPEVLWKSLADGINNCPPNGAFDQPAAEDKKAGASLFSRLLTRFDESIAYNTVRRNNAASTATASLTAYQTCVAQNPGTTANQALVKNTHGQGAATPSSRKSTGGSDITGIKVDEKKQAQPPQ